MHPSHQSTLVFHLGTRKTGTTSIQEWMSWLEQSGKSPISYARSGRYTTGHHALYNSFSKFGDASALVELRDDCLKSPDAPTLVSVEGLSLLAPREIDDLLSVFQSHPITVRAIAYLRPAVSFHTSDILQCLKTGFIAARPDMESILERSSLIFASLNHWAQRIGPENFTLVPFQPSKWPDNSLWSSWWQALGMDQPVDESTLPDVLRAKNVTPCCATLAVVCHLFRSMRKRQTKIRDSHELSRHLASLIETRLCALTDGEFSRKAVIFARHEREQLTAHYTSLLEKFEAYLGLEAPLFDLELIGDHSSDILWFTDPGNPALPEAERNIVAHLIEYGESLIGEQMELEDGLAVFKSENR